ncbi:MAG TPA: Calx-beta domain-containing protein [Acidobacteriota bacterium]|nr:Calx-beta domain-containing protein [Acidobacteriota bacterium]
MPHRIFRMVLPALLVTAVGCSDDEESPSSPGGNDLPTVSVNDQTVTEGNTAVFSVSLSFTTGADVVFHYATLNGTAVAGSDFAAIPLMTDTVPAGAPFVPVLIAILDDDEVEPVESFSLVLSGVTGARFADSIGVATILDDDVMSYAADVRGILTASCALVGCHGQGSSSGGMTLAQLQYDSVMVATGTNTGGKVVVAGNSSASTLYTKTLPTDDPLFPFPNRMPQSRPPLTVEQQHRIRDWIDQGARDN